MSLSPSGRKRSVHRNTADVLRDLQSSTMSKAAVIAFVLVIAVLPSNGRLLALLKPVDLSWPFDESSVYWPGVNSFVYTRKIAEYRDDGSWYAMNEFCTGEHGGTHLDAPYHFYKEGWKVADIPLSRLIAPGITVDISGHVAVGGPDVELEVEHLVNWEEVNGPLPDNCIVLVRFGWSQYYNNYDEYLGLNESEKCFPGISQEAAQWLADSGKVFGVGVDTASVDKGQSKSYMAHKILAEKQIYHMENVDMSVPLPATGFNLIVMPMKLKEGSGAPLRIIAVPDRKTIEQMTDYRYSSDAVPWYGHTSVVLSTLLLLGMYCINCFTL